MMKFFSISEDFLGLKECKGDSGVRGSPQSFESNLLQIGAGYTSDGCNDSTIVMIPEMTVMDMIPLLMLTVIRTEMEISYHPTNWTSALPPEDTRTVARKYHLRALKACDPR